MILVNDCPFCQRIAAGDYHPTSNDFTVRFEPLNPVTPGHMLFLPREHVANAALSPDSAAKAVRAASIWGRRMDQHFNLITSTGTLATQTVMHLHVHYVPRRLDDGLPLPWTGQLRY